MPLHRESERIGIRKTNRLYDTVRRMRFRDQSRPELVDALGVERIHAKRLRLDDWLPQQ
jgi:hypothetical protein